MERGAECTHDYQLPLSASTFTQEISQLQTAVTNTSQDIILLQRKISKRYMSFSNTNCPTLIFIRNQATGMVYQKLQIRRQNLTGAWLRGIVTLSRGCRALRRGGIVTVRGTTCDMTGTTVTSCRYLQVDIQPQHFQLSAKNEKTMRTVVINSAKCLK